MNIEEYRNFCLALPGVTEGFPFGPETIVFKVMNKMFALTNIETYDFVNLKCDPERAIMLREEYDGISPGWHMNKVHWNSVKTSADVDDELLKELIRHSYELIVESLPKKRKEELKLLS
ncbi:MAG TPA: MmcQ-like protein [Balneola sp.]|jgi:predicted DNA-binding protein (MmcQ/YjbR family)|nr:MmcQ-like protein [Balneola sp.]MBF63836.1 MmcQ-like protein [Balneola sp.]HAH50619.1 MmcQ-like protein [Balneola sp.]HAW78283.1 MmcQ-like protein [Balneola sp.]HBZ37908.1 MmcQ-like protein [Balneola sp.]|tara:strand:+ start:4035 stop:4391 length:357 start_codon:yes stop_codon:yes gene_type:complete